MKFSTIQDAFLNLKNDKINGISFINNTEMKEFISYADFYHQSLIYLYYLQGNGLKKCDKLIIQTELPKEFAIAFWACVLGGIIAIPVTPGSTLDAAKLVYSVAKQLEYPRIVINEKLKNQFKDFLGSNFKNLEKSFLELDIDFNHDNLGEVKDVDMYDIAMLQYSSGSTGSPKGAEITHDNLLKNISGLVDSCGLTHKDKICSWLPLTHNLGLIVMHILSIVTGISHILLPKDLFAVEPLYYLDIISEEKITISAAPNFAFNYIASKVDSKLNYNWDFSNFRIMWNGAEPIDIKACNAFNEKLHPYNLSSKVITPGYGMTEATVVITVSDPDCEIEAVLISRNSMKIGSTIEELSEPSISSIAYVHVGKAINTCEIRIVNEKNEVLTEKIIGRIQVKGPILMKSYHGQPELFKEMMVSDDWMNTGDIGFLRNECLFITGREKEIIVIGGKNYYPHDLEKICEEVDGVQKGQVVAIGISKSGSHEESIGIFIAQEIDNFSHMQDLIRKNFQKYGFGDIKYIVQIDSIPKTVSGKVRRNVIKEQFETSIIEAAKEPELVIKHFKSGDSINVIESSLSDIFSQELGSKMEADINLFDFGVSSIHLTSIVEKINRAFSMNLSLVEIFSYPTISDLAKMISKRDKNITEIDKEEIKETSRDVAVIGVDSIFPMADSTEEFWLNIKHGLDCIGSIPQNRFDDLIPILENSNYSTDIINTLLGGYLENIDFFDYTFFNITPKDAEYINPYQRLFLQVSWKALQDAGYAADIINRQKVGVYVGAAKSLYDYEKLIAIHNGGGYSDYAVSNLLSMVSGRVSYTMNLTGPSLTIDTACSSSLVAIHNAYNAILSGEVDMAIAGGVRINFMPVSSEIGIESSDGRTRAFDNSSDGTGFGEGVGAVVLKPLAKAMEDNDHIYCILKGTGVNQDGKTIGITAPNSVSQSELYKSVWNKIGINPETISYIEAHGTGTKLGDPIELTGLNNAIKKDTSNKQFCAVGSVKSNIGHLFEAAGIASFIKCIKMLENREIPRLINFSKINEQFSHIDSTALYIPIENISLKDTSDPFLCGVTSFGFSGTNAHVVLEEYREPIKTSKMKNNILVLSAKSEESLFSLLKEYFVFLANDNETPIENICFTSCVKRNHYTYRVGIVFREKQDLINELSKIMDYSSVEDIKGSEECLVGFHIDRVGLVSDDSKNEISADKKGQLSDKAHKILTETNIIDDTLLKELLQLYVKGATVPWALIYSGSNYSNVSVPTYNFAKTRSWIKSNTSGKINSQNINTPIIRKDVVIKMNNKTTNALLDIVSQTTGLEKGSIDVNKEFVALGLDSIALTQVRNAILNLMNVDIPINDFFSSLSTINKMADAITEMSVYSETKDNKVDIEDMASMSNLSNVPSSIAQTSTSHSPSTTVSTASTISPANIDSYSYIVNEQLKLMGRQLEFFANTRFNNTVSDNNPQNPMQEQLTISIIPGEETLTSSSTIRTNQEKSAYKPHKPIDFSNHNMTKEQETYILNLIETLGTKTRKSKEITQEYRSVYSNNRNVAGFRPYLKEIIYQIVSSKAQGSKLWDLDGNEYIDLTMGFGVNLFGHNPRFVTEAIQKELQQGFALGPMSEKAGEVARKISQLTKVERVAFFNTGTEAVMVAKRIARAFTKKKKIVIFTGSYHGSSDTVLAIPGATLEETIPLAPGVLDSHVEDMYVLSYNSTESLKFIEEHKSEIAAVLVESVQSRRPNIQPKEYLNSLRKVTKENDIALILDEVITGFRIGNGGAQEYFDIEADIVTYGKIVGGGMPIGIVAGKSKYLDSIDGGYWEYGDDSVPAKEDIRTFAAGTFCHHPLTMAASLAVLNRLEENNVQIEINRRTLEMASELNDFFESEGIPIQIVHFGSLFRFVLYGDLEIFFYILLNKGIYIWEGRNCFLSTEHSDEDVRKVIDIIKEAVVEMRANDFIEDSSKKKHL